MDVDAVISLSREGLKLALLLGAPVLTVGLIVGLVIGVIQAATQIQDQTISFVVKIGAVALTLSCFLPWSLEKLVEYSKNLLENIPETTTLFLQ